YDGTVVLQAIVVPSEEPKIIQHSYTGLAHKKGPRRRTNEGANDEVRSKAIYRDNTVKVNHAHKSRDRLKGCPHMWTVTERRENNEVVEGRRNQTRQRVQFQKEIEKHARHFYKHQPKQ